ncbi:hypothetical protein FNV43_RR03485 [Rhamnella rubrinervis]|uniref:F-box domain-containing protein n=1 Tax=Rhamnella rubrinervis TaxID=2594499 RepID=A0A8K0MNX8_9ROSA|nr:hypothetical protein FNV43_RR03485 [Rhamnella rubrinervis]
MAVFCDLPEEVVTEILLRLPLESLIRFKCVKRSWYALISDPAFVAKHLRLHHCNNYNKVSSSPSLFVRYLRVNSLLRREIVQEFSILNLVNDDDNGENGRVNSVVENFELPVIPGGKSLRLVSQCDGIILLAHLEANIALLWNPAIREFKVLQNSCFPDGFVILGVGFGYDCRANDYKAVRIVSSVNPNDGNHSRAEVYTLGTDSWREIKLHIKVGFIPGDRREVYCKGAYYWWIQNHIRTNMILSFDMCDEEFHEITVPVNVEMAEGMPSTLAVWNDSLALFISPLQRGVSKLIDMWVMDDCFGGVKRFSWTKHLVIETPSGISIPVAFWSSDELLMAKTYWKSDQTGFHTEMLVSYNLHTQKVRNLPICGVLPGSAIAFSFVKSLISVKGGTNPLQRL